MESRSSLLLRGLGGLALFLVLFTGAYYGFRYYYEQEEIAQTLALEQEIALGNSLHKLLLRTETIVQDSALQAVADTTLRRLVAANDLDRYPYTLTVIQNPQVNAFAMPGGHVVFFSGLIERLENPEQMAAIIAHELGHVEERHSLNRLIAQVGLATLTGGGASQEVLNRLLQLSYSRQQERSADLYAIDAMKKAELHPRHLARTFELFLEEQEESDMGGMEEVKAIISTHPGLEERIEDIEGAPMPINFEERPFALPEGTWAQAQQAARGY